MDGTFGVAISGDGNIAAAGGWHDQDQALLRVYDATTGTSLLGYTEIQHRVSCVSLSDDGNVLAAAADDVYLFVKTGTVFPATPLKMGIADAAHNFVSSVAVHPGGDWLAACARSWSCVRCLYSWGPKASTGRSCAASTGPPRGP